MLGRDDEGLQAAPAVLGCRKLEHRAGGVLVPTRAKQGRVERENATLGTRICRLGWFLEYQVCDKL